MILARLMLIVIADGSGDELLNEEIMEGG